MKHENFREKSYWLTTRNYHPGERLKADLDVDVAIVGGGFTGLSAAWHLKKAAPDLRVAIVESQVVGFGASGRNGGFNMTRFGLTLGVTAIRFGKEKDQLDLQVKSDMFFVNRRTIPWPQGLLQDAAIKAILGAMHWDDRRAEGPQR